MGRFEPGYAVMRAVVSPFLRAWFRLHYEGLEHIPGQGPAIVAANHISYLDGLVVAFGVHRAGRRPRFLVKSGLFGIPVVGWLLRTARHIPVHRGTRSAPQSLENAVEALRRGEVVVVFPEGTTTTHPDLRPLRPKTGVARLAIKAGLPVIPCATWGGQWFWTKHLGVKPGPGKEVWVRYGPPISLEQYGPEEDREVWHRATEAIMGEVGVLLASLKAAKPWTPQVPTRKKFIREQASREAARQRMG